MTDLFEERLLAKEAKNAIVLVLDVGAHVLSETFGRYLEQLRLLARAHGKLGRAVVVHVLFNSNYTVKNDVTYEQPNLRRSFEFCV